MKNAILFFILEISLLFPTFILANNNTSDFHATGCEVLLADDLSSLKKGFLLKGQKKRPDDGAEATAYFLIRFFQIVVSPQDGANCRFQPTCSRYGKEAIIKYGPILGSMLAGDRLLRCNPYYPPGKDPLPDLHIHQHKKKKKKVESK